MSYSLPQSLASSVQAPMTAAYIIEVSALAAVVKISHFAQFIGLLLSVIAIKYNNSIPKSHSLVPNLSLPQK